MAILIIIVLVAVAVGSSEIYNHPALKQARRMKRLRKREYWKYMR